jgi:hypothetical protein
MLTLGKTNIDMENPPFFWIIFLGFPRGAFHIDVNLYPRVASFNYG